MRTGPWRPCFTCIQVDVKRGSPGLFARGFVTAKPAFPGSPSSLQRFSIELEPDVGVRIRTADAFLEVIGIPGARSDVHAAKGLASASGDAGRNPSIGVRGVLLHGRLCGLGIWDDIARTDAGIIGLSERRSCRRKRETGAKQDCFKQRLRRLTRAVSGDAAARNERD